MNDLSLKISKLLSNEINGEILKILINEVNNRLSVAIAKKGEFIVANYCLKQKKFIYISSLAIVTLLSGMVAIAFNFLVPLLVTLGYTIIASTTYLKAIKKDKKIVAENQLEYVEKNIYDLDEILEKLLKLQNTLLKNKSAQKIKQNQDETKHQTSKQPDFEEYVTAEQSHRLQYAYSLNL